MHLCYYAGLSPHSLPDNVIAYCSDEEDIDSQQYGLLAALRQQIHQGHASELEFLLWFSALVSFETILISAKVIPYEPFAQNERLMQRDFIIVFHDYLERTRDSPDIQKCVLDLLVQMGRAACAGLEERGEVGRGGFVHYLFFQPDEEWSWLGAREQRWLRRYVAWTRCYGHVQAVKFYVESRESEERRFGEWEVYLGEEGLRLWLGGEGVNLVAGGAHAPPPSPSSD
ncbi:hypothetical protein OQA88_11991 [Cercophora sp. LCS_1]